MNSTDTTPINYTISADGGLSYINVYSHTSDFETRILPLQWAIDQVCVSFVLCVQVLNITSGNHRAQIWTRSAHSYAVAIYTRN